MRRRRRSSRRGASVVEVLVVVGVVITFGLVGLTAIGKSAQSAAAHEGSCIETMGGCGAGSQSGDGGKLATFRGEPATPAAPTATMSAINNSFWEGFFVDGVKGTTNAWRNHPWTNAAILGGGIVVSYFCPPCGVGLWVIGQGRNLRILQDDWPYGWRRALGHFAWRVAMTGPAPTGGGIGGGEPPVSSPPEVVPPEVVPPSTPAPPLALPAPKPPAGLIEAPTPPAGLLEAPKVPLPNPKEILAPSDVPPELLTSGELPVYRGTPSTPAEVRARGGFSREGSRGRSLDEHVNPAPSRSSRDQWVSTSKLSDTAMRPMYAGPDGYVYRIREAGGVDVNAVYGETVHGIEHEVTYQNVPWQRIEGWQGVEGGYGPGRHLGPFVPNPEYVP